MQRTIDLNCDLGEGAGQDADLMPLITSASIACGAHAGNRATMIAAVKSAKANRVSIGAHPGYFDRENFGRVERPITGEEAGRLVLMQIEQLLEVIGARLQHVKLHGALYNQVCRDRGLAEAVVAALARRWPDLVVFALAGSPLVHAARQRGLPVAEEVFADRTYQRDGSLTPRVHPAALITDEGAAVAQVLRIIQTGAVRATDGTDVPMRADTVCVHGDGPQAVVLARRLRTEVEAAGVRVAAFGRG